MSIAFFSDARDEAAEKCPTRDASPPLEIAFLNKIGSGSDIQNESFRTFVLNIAHLALSLNKIGCGSAKHCQASLNVFRSPCTIFAEVITDFYEE